MMTRRRSPPRCSRRTRAATWTVGRGPARRARATRRRRRGRHRARRRAASGSSPSRPSQAEEVEVADRDAAVLVAAGDRERRAGHRHLDAEGAGGAAHERRLAGAELARDQDDVAPAQRSRRAPRRAPRSRPASRSQRRPSERAAAQQQPGGHERRRPAGASGMRSKPVRGSSLGPAEPCVLGAAAARRCLRLGGRLRRRRRLLRGRLLRGRRLRLGLRLGGLLASRWRTDRCTARRRPRSARARSRGRARRRGWRRQAAMRLRSRHAGAMVASPPPRERPPTPHPAPHRPRLDPPRRRRHRHGPVRPGQPLDRVGPSRDGDRRRLQRAPSSVSHPHERLTIHRMGTRLTVFPRAAWATLRGLGRDADVVLEVVQRHRLLHAAVAMAAQAARAARPPRPPGPLRHRAGPARRGSRRFLLERAAAAAASIRACRC